jgi:hypothetical protein
MVDEFYWQGVGGPPPYWKGNVVDRDGTKEVSMKPKLVWPDDVISGMKESNFE